MKRSPMPRRLAPLERRTPLAEGKPLGRGGRLAAVGRKARREAPALREFRRVIRERSGGACEIRVSPYCSGRMDHAHHCCPADRDRGVHDPERGLGLCAACHAHVHAHPERSYRWGHLIRDQIQPEEHP